MSLKPIPLLVLPALLAVLAILTACGPDEESPPPAKAGFPTEYGGPSGPLSADTALEEPDWSAVVATVNGEPITRRLLANQAALAAAEQPLPEDVGAEEWAAEARALETEELRNLIILELACQEALRLGYAPAEEELGQALAHYENDFDEPEQLYRALDEYGATGEDFKKQLAKNMALKKWQAYEFLPEIKVEEAEARAFYQAHRDRLRHDEMLRLSQILVGVSLLAPLEVKAQARARAEAVLERLARGEDFGAVAAEVNTDSGAAENRGDQGWFVRGQNLDPIEAEVWRLPVGAHTGVLSTIMGFHIVKVTGRRPPGVEPFESLKPELVEFISARKLEEAVDRRIQELALAADIEILDPALAEARPAAGAPRGTSAP